MSAEDQAVRNAQAENAASASPFAEQPGICGHCGASDTEAQGHNSQCHKCGKWSTLEGKAIQGNPHVVANRSESFPWVNDLSVPFL